ncbi:MAG: NADH-quinone oxidoreductase subunit J [Pseudomonadota bacterium]
MIVFAFYLFAICVITGALFAVTSRDPVHAVLWLLLAFLSSAGLFILLGAEYIALLVIFVYGGAITLLFLFVIMMLNVDFAALKAETSSSLRFMLLVGVVALMQSAIAFGAWETNLNVADLPVHAASAAEQNTTALAIIFYDSYFVLFQLAGLILLVSLVGAVFLTLRHRVDAKAQDDVTHLRRDPRRALKLKNLKPRQGT